MGYNEVGQLGIGENPDKSVPIQILSEKKFETISAGTYHSFGVDDEGNLWAWGRNDRGQLGTVQQTIKNFHIKLSWSFR